MNDFSHGFSGGSFSQEAVDYSKLYIPEAMDCQSCGYCLKDCPTYNVRPENNYSPRGRVRLIERIVKKNDVLSDDEFEALNACTLCRSCETVCPSKMDYVGLYHQAMEAHEAQENQKRAKQKLAIKALYSIVEKGPSSQRALRALIDVYQRSGLQWLLRRFPVSPLVGDFKQLDALLPTPYEPITIPSLSPTTTPERLGEVALFTGCVGSILDTQTHDATVQLLTALGYDVRVVPNQTCCGAVYAHNGDVGRAKDSARKNGDVFSRSGADAVIFNSSGCGAFLREYDALLNEEEDVGDPEPCPPIVDIMEFLVEDDRIDALSFAKLGKKVAVHEPCTQRNVLKTHDVIYGLLARIPGLDVAPLSDNAMCCGAGGTKMLTQPELASPLRDQKVKALLDAEVDILLSTNLTCALHLACGVREAGRKIEVLHPVSLLKDLISKGG